MNTEKEVENVEKKETTKEITVKVFTRDTLTIIQIGSTIYGPFGKTKFLSEKEVEERIQELAVHEIQNFNVAINHYDSLLEFECKYFALRFFAGQVILHIEDKHYPEYNWIQTFEIANEEATKLLQYIIARAETVSFNL